MALVLDSRLSDDFGFGHRIELKLPSNPELERRIIRYRTPLYSYDQREMQDFFRQYTSQERMGDGMSSTAVGEFLLEQFLEECLISGELDEVKYFEGEPLTKHTTRNYSYTFIDNGRKVRVNSLDGGNKICELPRLVELRRGSETQVVVCKAKVGRNNRDRSFPHIRICRELLGLKRKNISFLKAYPLDSFQDLMGRRTSNGCSLIEAYLSNNPRNNVLVYSTKTNHIRKKGKRIARLNERERLSQS